MVSKTNHVLTRDDILGRDDSRVELMDVPEWGGQVYVRGIGADERDNFEDLGLDPKTREKRRIPNFRARYAVLVLCDSEGRPIFTESDIDSLGKKSAAALDRVLDKGIELSRMGPDAIEEAKEDFGDGPSVDSGSV